MISLQTLRGLFQYHNRIASILWCSAFFMVQLSHPYMTTGKAIALTIQTFVSKVMTLFFNTLSRFCHTFSSKEQAAINVCSDFGAQENKICHCFHFLPICYEVIELDAIMLVFLMMSFKPNFSLTSFTFIKRLFSFSSLSAISVVSSAYLKLLIFLPAILIPASDSSNLPFCMMYSA